MKKYKCGEENQKYVDYNKIKSNCCNEYILANSLDEYFCNCCCNKCEVEE